MEKFFQHLRENLEALQKGDEDQGEDPEEEGDSETDRKGDGADPMSSHGPDGKMESKAPFSLLFSFSFPVVHPHKVHQIGEKALGKWQL